MNRKQALRLHPLHRQRPDRANPLWWFLFSLGPDHDEEFNYSPQLSLDAGHREPVVRQPV
ncbi:hypothetical protein HS125_16140 [bacterium]|nr:hypothetical protein [bacterium]